VARPKAGMGRGLSAILSVSNDGAAAEDELRQLPVELISSNVRQPRRRFDEEALRGLAESVGERGLLQPVLVRPRAGGTYELIAGERRWRAARIAGIETIPALVREHDDAAALELALIENMAREDLSPIEEARACAALVEELELTREDVGRRIGRSRVAVSNLIRLLDLPDETIALLQQGELSEGHGRALLLAEDHADRRSLARAAVDGGWSVRVTEQRARESNSAGPRRERIVGGPAGRGVHPDQEAASREIAEALAQALGSEVRVKPRRGGRYSAELVFDSPEQALELARGLLRPTVR
jgi:ParB family transcriptional regulator, chromosome partitioning protein